MDDLAVRYGRTAATRHDDEAFFVGERDQRGGLLDGRGRHGPARLDAVDCVTTVAHMLGADDGAQRVGERGRRRDGHRTRPMSRTAVLDATGGIPRRTRDARARVSRDS